MGKERHGPRGAAVEALRKTLGLLCIVIPLLAVGLLMFIPPSSFAIIKTNAVPINQNIQKNIPIYLSSFFLKK